MAQIPKGRLVKGPYKVINQYVPSNMCQVSTVNLIQKGGLFIAILECWRRRVNLSQGGFSIRGGFWGV